MNATYLSISAATTRNLIEFFFILPSTTEKKVSASPYEHMLGKPDVKYIGGIHGNEAVGRELLLHLIQYFVTNYHTDPYIKWLLDNTRIHILPSLNVSQMLMMKFSKIP